MELWLKERIDQAWDEMERHVKNGDYWAAYICLFALRKHAAKRSNWDEFNNDVTKAVHIANRCFS